MERWKRSLAGIVLCITVSVPSGADDEIADAEFPEFLEFLGTRDENGEEWDEFFDSLPDPDNETTDDGTDESAI